MWWPFKKRKKKEPEEVFQSGLEGHCAWGGIETYACWAVEACGCRVYLRPQESREALGSDVQRSGIIFQQYGGEW